MMTDHQLDTAISGAAALAMMQGTEYDVVVSDMRMPVMDGQQFLAQVRRRFPDVIRYILSGYADREIVLEAARMGDAKGFLLKPWNNHELIEVIERALQEKKRNVDEGVQYLIATFHDLPLEKGIKEKLQGFLSADHPTAMVAEALTSQACVVTAVLRIAWIAFPGNRPTGFLHALSLLGADNVNNLINSLPQIDTQLYDKDSIWNFSRINRHCYLTQRKFAQLLKKMNISRMEVDSDYLGIVHDFGRLLMSLYQNDSCKQVEKLVLLKGEELCPAERKVFGFDHAVLTARLMEWWGLPPLLCQAVEWHHRLEEAPAHVQRIAALLQLADYLTQVPLGNPMNIKISAYLPEILQVNLDELVSKEGSRYERVQI